MAIFDTYQTGVWNDGGNWSSDGGSTPNTSPGVEGTDFPGSIDTAIVATGHEITVNVTTSVFYIDLNGTVFVDAELLMDGQSASPFHAIHINDGGLLDINHNVTFGATPGQGDIFWIYSGGTMQIDPARIDKDITLTVNGPMGCFGGAFKIGTVASPIPSAYHVDINVELGQAQQRDWYFDATTGGEVILHGAYKQTVTKIAADVAINATSITMEDSDPTGWAVDDEIYSGSWSQDTFSRSEQFDVASIAGTALGVKNGDGAGGGVKYAKKDAVANRYGQFIVNTSKNISFNNIDNLSGVYNTTIYFNIVKGQDQTVFFDNVVFRSMGGTSATRSAIYLDYDGAAKTGSSITLTDLVFHHGHTSYNSSSYSIDIDYIDNGAPGTLTIGEIATCGMSYSLFLSEFKAGHVTVDLSSMKIWGLGKHWTRNNNSGYCVYTGANIFNFLIPYVNAYGFLAMAYLAATPVIGTIITEGVSVTSEGYGLWISQVNALYFADVDSYSVDQDFYYLVENLYHYATSNQSSSSGIYLTGKGGSFSIKTAEIYGCGYAMFVNEAPKRVYVETMIVGGMVLSPVNSSTEYSIWFNTDGVYMLGEIIIDTLIESDTVINPTPSTSFKVAGSLTGNVRIGTFTKNSSNLFNTDNDPVTTIFDMAEGEDDSNITIRDFDGSVEANYGISYFGVKTSTVYAGLTDHTEVDFGMVLDPTHDEPWRPMYISFDVPVNVGPNSMDIYLSKSVSGWDGEIQIISGKQSMTSDWVGFHKSLQAVELTIATYDGTDPGWSKNTINLGTRTAASMERVTIAVTDGATSGTVYVGINGGKAKMGMLDAVSVSGGGGGSSIGRVQIRG